MTDAKLVLEPEKPALLAGFDNTFNLLARIQVANAPEQATADQVPINLAIVIDCSGSMAGDPLREAKCCAKRIVNKLRPDDKVSIVTFSEEVEVVVPVSRAWDREAICYKIDTIRSRGMTDLHGGWMAGADELAKVHEEGEISRVLILSDGMANLGELNETIIFDHCKRMANTGITTSTYGLGEHFSEIFMSLMAEAGLGNAYYGELANDLENCFEEEFSLLQYTCSTDVLLKIDKDSKVGVKVKNPYNRISHATWKLPNLAWGGETWALFEVSIPKEKLENAGLEPLVLNAKVYRKTMSGEQAEPIEATLQLPLVGPESYEAMTPSATVLQRKSELIVADISHRARLAARHHDWDHVDRLIREAEQEAGDHEWLQGAVKALYQLARRRERERFSKESLYTAARFSRRIASADEDRDYSLSKEDAKLKFLQRKLRQGKSLWD